MSQIIKKYAHLLVNYCLDIQPGDRLLIKSSLLAEPLIREVYRACLEAGGHPETSLEFHGQHRIFINTADDAQLDYIRPGYETAIKSYEAYLYIRAPYNLREGQDLDGQKLKRRQKALADINRIYFERTGDRSLKRSLCQFPTLANAQEAGMSLEAYEEFVYSACRLYDDNPIDSWLDVRRTQQVITDHLNQCTEVKYQGPNVDLSFRTKGRTWINSDGQTNMPSGEVYTSPEEDSVNGWIRFSYPGIYHGHEVQDVQLWVKDGYIERWEASQGKDFLDHIFSLKGTRRFGEAAIGTNYRINRMTKNILFDEKIGGTVHLAIGQSYLQAGGKNESSVHWDLITDMQQDAQILADGERIYQNGKFLIQ